jgi:trans-aconitate 2-methyltransferase
MSGTGWDPAQYLRFAGDRLRPSIDLLARVGPIPNGPIVDLGCGPGNVTPVLRTRFPTAELIGIDTSPEMLARARAAEPSARFEQGDIATWRPELPPALIFSNAALHWLDGHETLFPRLLGLLAPGGQLAVQMPAMHDAPLRRLQYTVAAEGPWAARLKGVGSAPEILEPAAYWDLLRPRAAAFDLWQTTYWHVLTGEDAVVTWAEGSSLRPFLDALDDPVLRGAFRAAYTDALRPHYKRRPDGTTLLPFRRLFMVATAPA